MLPTLNEDGSRYWIRPKPSHGAWWHRRRVMAYGLMAIFFAAPHLRFMDKPVFLMDLPHRQFTLMGYTFLPTDTLLFMFAFGAVVIGIFLLTALFGRAWCGWACPQTVYLEFLFRPIGRWFDGGYSGSRHLDKRHAWFTPRRIAKYITFFLLSLFVSHTFLAFFVGTEALYDWNFPKQMLALRAAGDQDSDVVVRIVTEAAAALQQDPDLGPWIIDPVEVMGMDDLTGDKVTMKFRIKTVPLKQADIARELRRRVKQRFHEEGIRMPGARMEVTMRNPQSPPPEP